MSNHNVVINPVLGQNFGFQIKCKNCSDALSAFLIQKETWIDSDETVYFNSADPSKLIEFIINHHGVNTINLQQSLERLPDNFDDD